MTRKEHLEKYLNKQSSEEEKMLVTIWITGLMERVNNGVASEEEKNIINNYWQLQEKKINIDTEQVEKRKAETLFFLEKNILSHSKKKATFFKYAAAAAVLLMLSTGAYFIYHLRQEKSIISAYSYPAANNTVESTLVFVGNQKSSVKSIQLPDNSSIYLNNHAIVSIDTAAFNINTRTVELKNGEAFFEVAKNINKPFSVRFGKLQLQVTGTSFNIENYSNDEDKRVFVKTGTVILKTSKKVLTTLSAGDIFVYHSKTGNYIVTKNTNADYSRWINGDLIFADADIQEIKLKIKNKFGLTVLVENNALPTTLQLNATFNKTDPPEKIAEVIGGIYEAKVRLLPHKIIFYK